MAMLIKLAFRNIFRFKRRTFITFFATSIGLALLIISISILNGMDKQSISNIIQMQTSHLKVFQKGYFAKKDDIPMEIVIKSPQKLQDIIARIKGVKRSEKRILFGASIIKGADELPCLGVAIEPEVDPEIFDIKKSMVEGEWLKPEDNQVLVGADLARDIGLLVGDSITVRMISSSEEDKFSWNAVDLEIKGMFNTGNPTVDSNRILIPLKLAGETLSMESAVTEIVVKLESDDKDLIERVKNEMSLLLKVEENNLEIYSWEELAGTFLAISQMKTKSTSMIIIIMLLIASMGIVNTMLTSVMERTREIGMPSAMGMKKKEITRLFILEGAFIGMIGSFIGCILGGLAGWYLEVHGWSFASLGKTMNKITAAAYPVKDVLYADLTLDTLVMTFFLGILVSVLASFYPARKAAKRDPIEALRHI